MKKFSLFLLLTISLLATGCLYESAVPFTFQKGAIDPLFSGTWEQMQSTDFYVKISATAGDLRFAYHDKVTHKLEETLQGYCARLGGVPFIIYRTVEDGKAKYTFLKYAFEQNNNVLKVTPLDEDLFRENGAVQDFTTATALRNYMLKNIEKIRAYTDSESSISYARKNSVACINWQKKQQNAALAYPQSADKVFSASLALQESPIACPAGFLGTWMHDSKIKRVKIGVTQALLHEYSVSVSLPTQNADNTWLWNDYQPSQLKFFDIEGVTLAQQKVNDRYYFFQYYRQNNKLVLQYVNEDYVKQYRPDYLFDGSYDMKDFFARHIKRPGFFTAATTYTPAGASSPLTLEEQQHKVWDTWFARYGYQEAPYDRAARKYNPQVTFETKYESNSVGGGIWIGTAHWTTAKYETGECTMYYDRSNGMRIFSENALALRLAGQEISSKYAAQTSKKQSSQTSSDDNAELKSRALLGILGMIVVGALILSGGSDDSSNQARDTYRPEIVGYDAAGIPITNGPTSRTIVYDTSGKRIRD